MLDVFLTCDTEVWCPGWDRLDSSFPDSFQRYVYGRASDGKSYGLPFQLASLRDHGLTGVFFVEPLFSGRFGMEPLREIVGLIRDGGQEVQLHLHTEWADEARVRLLEHVTEKRQHIRHFSVDEQEVLISAGAAMIEAAGGERPTAFRAGSFALNRDTLAALSRCGIRIDSSYNATMLGATSGVGNGRDLRDVTQLDDIVEYPISVFTDGFRRLRHAQIGACSFEELRQALWAALEAKQRAFVVVFHNFELMNSSKTGCDTIVTRRFQRLCRFLDENRSHFRTRGFRDVGPSVGPSPSREPRVHVGALATGWRFIEQATRRLSA